MGNHHDNMEQQGQKQQTNFRMDELKKRAEIKKKTKDFKKAIDIAKESKLNCIKKVSKQRENDINGQLALLESALAEDDIEQIKAALKNFKM